MKIHEAAKKGRYEDDTLAHVSTGEMVVPSEIIKRYPALKNSIMEAIAREGGDPSEYLVGVNENKINPETGLPEFFFKRFFKSVKKVLKKIAPVLSIALPVFFPGIGAALGAGLGFTTNAALAGNALLGAGLGAAGGGGVRGAALGGLGGALAGSNLAGSLAGSAGLGEAATAGLTGAIKGGGLGLASSGGDLKTGLLGAATGGLGSYYSAGGFGNLLSGGSGGLEGSLAGGTAAASPLGPATAAGAAPSSSGFLSSLGNPFNNAFDLEEALSGAVRGGLGGLASGGGLENIAGGAALGGLGGGFGSSIGSSFGLSPEQTTALTGALTGASGGLAAGDAQTALLGGGIGALTNYYNAGGFEDTPLGARADRPLAGAQGPVRPGTGLASLTDDLSNRLGIGQTPTGESKLNLGSLLSGGADVFDYLQTENDIDRINQIYSRQAQLAQRQFQPYVDAGAQALANLQAPNLEALQNDPGYQFQLAEGNKALTNYLGAQGLRQSGEAIRRAQEFGQGLADQTYQNFFNRNFALAGRGQQAASSLGNIFAGLGDVRAQSRIQDINQRNRLLSGLGRFFA